MNDERFIPPRPGDPEWEEYSKTADDAMAKMRQEEYEKRKAEKTFSEEQAEKILKQIAQKERAAWQVPYKLDM